MIKSYVATRDGKEPIIAYTGDEVKLPCLTFKSLQRNHKYRYYAKQFMCLDTETSHIDQTTGWIYQWAIKWCDRYIYGRTPTQLMDFFDRVAEYYQLDDDNRIIIYVHNLQYDFTYLKRYLLKYDPRATVLAIDNHAVLTVDVLGFRFICSYKLTNMSLEVLSNAHSKKYVKAVGEIDYTLVRYQDTPLSADSDWFYQFSDVAAQMDGVTEYLAMNGFDFAADAPFTSTGFVRNVCRKASKLDERWRIEFERSALNLEQYRLCRQAFMGGITICSYEHTGELITGVDLGHDDFTSSYPARQMCDYMPVGQPMDYGDLESKEELENLLNEYCCVFLLTLDDVHIKSGVTAPYIPRSKCIHIEDELKVNGKVVFAKTLTIAVTEMDYKWIKRQYDAAHTRVENMLCFTRGEMPQWLKKEIMYYFKNKCELKYSDPVLYAKSKNILNGIYGMTATSIIREMFKMDSEGIISKYIYEDTDIQDEKALKKYYKSYNSFLEYQHALWTTAHARDALMHMISEVVGYENFLYCDTDSVFYIKTPENVARMEEYREQCRQKAREHGAFVGDKYLGEPTPEPPITAFKGLHAKCYAMIEDCELSVTIAGIPKKSTKWINGKRVEKTNAEELGKLDNLEDGFKFKHCGGTRCIYNEHEITTKMIRGHMTEYAASAIIENIEKEINDTMWTKDADYNVLKLHQETV